MLKSILLLLAIGIATSHSSQSGTEDGSFLLPRVCTPTDTSFLPTFNIVLRLLGGQQVTPGEMPWMLRLSIYSDGQRQGELGSRCSGFLVNRLWAMTAAHCLDGAQKITISAGRIDYSIDSPAEVVLNVTSENFFIHPGYSNQHKMHDIALIKLPNIFRHVNSVSPICILDNNHWQELPRLRTDDEDDCGMVFAAGWGTTETERESQVLRKINMTVVGRRHCNRNYPNHTISSSQLCAVGQEFDSPHGPMFEDTCRGDSGGPLMCKVDGSMTADGIVSFGRGCGTGNPGVYTRVCSYKNWIMQTMNISGCEVPRMEHATFQIDGSLIENRVIVPLQTSISIVCDSDFYPNVTANSAVISTCQSVNQWSPPLAQCVPSNSRCGNLPAIFNGRAVTSLYTIDAVAIILCDEGYELQGNYMIRCLPTLQWSAPNGRCVRSAPASITCGPVPTILNGNIDTEGGNALGTSRNVICMPGFRLVGGSRIFCQFNGQWSEPGRCEQGEFLQFEVLKLLIMKYLEQMCPNPLQPANGQIGQGENKENNAKSNVRLVIN